MKKEKKTESYKVTGIRDFRCFVYGSLVKCEKVRVIRKKRFDLFIQWAKL
jgi:hypothetical protein